jgi:ribosomal protein L15E
MVLEMCSDSCDQMSTILAKIPSKGAEFRGVQSSGKYGRELAEDRRRTPRDIPRVRRPSASVVIITTEANAHGYC